MCSFSDAGSDEPSTRWGGRRLKSAKGHGAHLTRVQAEHLPPRRQNTDVKAELEHSQWDRG